MNSVILNDDFTTTEISGATLKSGLEMIIDRVEKSKELHFDMNSFNDCVIGKTIGWVGCCFETGDWETVNALFGLDKPLNKKLAALNPDNRHNIFSKDEFDVIRLFTCDIGHNINKGEWLNLAKEQLSKMS